MRLSKAPGGADLFKYPEMKKKSGTWNVHKKLTRKSAVGVWLDTIAGRWPNTIK